MINTRYVQFDTGLPSQPVIVVRTPNNNGVVKPVYKYTGIEDISEVTPVVMNSIWIPKEFNVDWNNNWISNTGSISDLSNTAVSNFHEINQAKVIKFSVVSSYLTLIVAYYDENYNFIRRDSVTTAIYTLNTDVPSNAKYYKVGLSVGYTDTITQEILDNMYISILLDNMGVPCDKIYIIPNTPTTDEDYEKELKDA